MATRIRLLVAVPGAGRSGDVVELSRGEAAAWVDAGRAEFVDAPEPYEAAVPRVTENTARRTRRPRGRA